MHFRRNVARLLDTNTSQAFPTHVSALLYQNIPLGACFFLYGVKSLPALAGSQRPFTDSLRFTAGPPFAEESSLSPPGLDLEILLFEPFLLDVALKLFQNSFSHHAELT